ncbi:ankyrin repeat protein, partial [Lophium mytilinum]
KNTKKKLQTALNTFQKGFSALNEAYDAAIDRIERQQSGDRESARAVLSWIIYAERQLTARELCHALAVEPGDKELDPDNIPDIEDLVSVCAGLVTFDYDSDNVRLVHYTTQEYFERIRQRWIPKAQEDITSICLTYLCFDTFKSGDCAGYIDFRTRLRINPLLHYAARY